VEPELEIRELIVGKFAPGPQVIDEVFCELRQYGSLNFFPHYNPSK